MRHFTQKIALAVALLAAGCSQATQDSPGTAIALRVSYDDSWGLTEIEVALPAEEKRGRLSVRHDVRVLVNDALAGEPVTLTVSGYRRNAGPPRA